MAGIVIGDKIKNTDRGAINLDADYGPFASVEAATTALTTAKKLKTGRTVGITQQDGSIKEYWVQPKGTTPETYGLVVKGEDLTKALSLSGEQKHNASANINDRAADVDQQTSVVKALGYKVLNPAFSFAEQVESTQTVDNSNMIFEIKDEFDLEEGSVTIPTNCTLKFNGGRIINGTLIGNNSTIVSNETIFQDVVIEGTWNCKGNVRWWCKGCDVVINDNSYSPVLNDEHEALQQALDSSFKELYFPVGLYYTSQTLTLTKSKKLLLDGERLPTYLYRALDDINNACVVFTNQDITLLRIGGISSTDNLSYEIVGGNFDVSLVGAGNYNSNCIEISTENTAKIWGLRIETNIFGAYTWNTPSKGKGIVIPVTTDQTLGYATMIRIDSIIERFGVGVECGPKNQAWVTDIKIGGQITRCKNAIVTWTDTLITTSIQPTYFFEEELNGEACIVVKGSAKVAVAGMIWDVRQYSSSNQRWSNQYRLKVENSNAKVQLIEKADLYITNDDISGYKNCVKRGISTNDYIPRYGDKGNFNSSPLYDSIIGFNTMGIGSYGFKLYTYDEETETHTETTPTVTSIEKIFADNGLPCTVGLTNPLGSNDYLKFSLNLGGKVRLGTIVFTYRNFDLTAPSKAVLNVYDGSSKKFSYTQDLEYYIANATGYYLKYVNVIFPISEITPIDNFEILIYSEGLTQILVQRVSMYAYRSDTETTGFNQLNPFVNRLGGRIYGTLDIRGILQMISGSEFKLKDLKLDSNGDVSGTYNLLPSLVDTSHLIGVDLSGNANPKRLSFLVYLFGGEYEQNIYNRRNVLYGIDVMSNGASSTSSYTRYRVTKVFGNGEATFDFYFSDTDHKVLIKCNAPKNKNISLIAPNSKVFAKNGVTIPSGYTAVSSSYVFVLNGSGSSTDRPTPSTTGINKNAIEVGYKYFDTTLGKPVYWNGNGVWVDAMGEPVGLQVSDTTVLIGAAANSTKEVSVYYPSGATVTINVQNPDGTANTDFTAVLSTNTLTITATAANSTSAPIGVKVIVSDGTDVKIINVVQSY